MKDGIIYVAIFKTVSSFAYFWRKNSQTDDFSVCARVCVSYMWARVCARARARMTACMRARRVFVRFAINIKQDGDQEPYEYNSDHLQPSPSDSTNERRSRSSVTEWNFMRGTGRNMAGDSWAITFFRLYINNSQVYNQVREDGW